jgi:Uri superfamily endonuclease
MDSGIYNLIILLLKDKTITIGKLGKFSFPKGYYVYTGSARKNLSSRIERHKRKDNKKLKWHIDYLLNCKYAEIKNVRIYNNGKSDECSLNKKIMKLKSAEIIVKGFGSSDCKNSCPAHLIYFKNIPKYL